MPSARPEPRPQVSSSGSVTWRTSLRRSEGARLGQGAGLGLSIVQRYAELMQAEFRLDEGDGGTGLRASTAFLPAASL